MSRSTRSRHSALRFAWLGLLLGVGVAGACSGSHGSATATSSGAPSGATGQIVLELHGAGCLPERVFVVTDDGEQACASVTALLDAFRAAQSGIALPPMTWLLAMCADSEGDDARFAHLCDDAASEVGAVDPQVDQARVTCSLAADYLLAERFRVPDVKPEGVVVAFSGVPDATADEHVQDDVRRVLAGEPGPFTALDRYFASCFVAPAIDPAQTDQARQLLEGLAADGFLFDSAPVALSGYPRGKTLSAATSAFGGHRVELLVLQTPADADELIAALGGELDRFRCGSFVFNINPNGTAGAAELEQATAQARDLFNNQGLCPAG